jgi:hypothetical protein
VKQIVMLFTSATLFLLGGSAYGGSDVLPEFDLICRGIVREANWSKAWDKAVPTSIETHLRVDLQRNAFCVDDYCDRLTRADAAMLEYHCKATKGGKFCDATTFISSAGPFITQQDFSVDRSTGAFQRTLSGEVGDHGVKPFRSESTGVCVPAPFTGLSTPSR